MTDHLLHARLFNGGGELIAEGPCWIDEAAKRATLEPEHEPGVIQKERGRFTLQLESGRTWAVSDSPFIFKLGKAPDGEPANEHRSLYRLKLLGDAPGAAHEEAQEANAAGAVAEGSATPPAVGLRENGETPAAR